MSGAVSLLWRGWNHEVTWGLPCHPWRPAGPLCQGWASLTFNQTQHQRKSVKRDNNIHPLFPPECVKSREETGDQSWGGVHAKALTLTCFLRRIGAKSGFYWKPDDNLCRYNISLNIFLPTTFPVCCSFYFNYCIPNDLPFSQQDWKILKDPRSNLWAIIWFSFLAVCTVPISVTLEYSSPQSR